VGFSMCSTAFKNEVYLLFFLGGVIAFFSTISIPVFIKNIIKPVPYLILTEQELIMNPGAKKPIRIKWEDVEGYRIRTFNTRFNTLTVIEIVLYVEEKDKKQMTKITRKFNAIGTMGGNFNLVSIHLEQIKVTEQSLLLDA